MFDTISDAILLIGIEPDGHFRLLLANAAFTRNTGHSKDVIGKLVEEVVTPESYRLLKRRYQKVATTKQAITYTEWYDVPLGRREFEVKLIPILNAVGQCAQIAAVTHDSTEFHNLREENKALRLALQKAGKATPQ